MLDHLSFAVKDYDSSVIFYDQTLAILGYKKEASLEFPGGRASGYGTGGVRPRFWISSGGLEKEEIGLAKGLHVAFRAPSVRSVQEWYQQCLLLGATDNGEPGPREYYHAGYYGAFVIDPNGWRLEACLHDYQETP